MKLSDDELRALASYCNVAEDGPIIPGAIDSEALDRACRKVVAAFLRREEGA